MEKLDKVIAGIEWCWFRDGVCRGCPYEGSTEAGDCGHNLELDTLEVLKELGDDNHRLREMWAANAVALSKVRVERDDLRKDIEVLTEDLAGAHEEVHKLAKNLKVARAERDCERAKMTRIVGMAHKEWLEKVHPDWYSRLEELDYNYDPVKDGTPWYRAEDVWACIEDVSGDHREFGAHMDEEAIESCSD